MNSSLPPLLPKVDAILVLDGDGNRLAGKYYGNFMKVGSATSAEDTTTTTNEATTNGSSSTTDNATAAQSVEQLRASFERQLQSKIGGIAARPDAAEVVTVLGKTAVFCGGASNPHGGGGGAQGADVRVVHIGPSGESELLLAHLCEGVYDALSQLMGGATDRNMILDNLELVFLLIDEHCDGGIILEVDGSKLASSVLLRDEEQSRMGEMGMDGQGMPQGGGGQPSQQVQGGGMGQGFGGMGGDMTIAQALMQARNQIISNLGA